MNAVEILREFVEGKLDEPLLNLSVSCGGVSIKPDSGRLTANGNGAPELTLFTPHYPVSIEPDGRPNSLVPEGAFTRVEAVSERGWQVVAERLYGMKSSMRAPGFGRISFRPSQVFLRRRNSSPSKCILAGFIHSFPEEVENTAALLNDENPMFGFPKRREWLHLEMEKLRIGLRKESDRLCEVRIWSSDEAHTTLLPYGNAFLEALSFLVGRQFYWLCHWELSHHKEEVVLLKPTEVTASFFPPLPRKLETSSGDPQTELLKLATQFFLTSESEATWTALQICRNASDGMFASQCLLACAAVEGLADYIVDQSPRGRVLDPERKEFDKTKQAAISLLSENDQIRSSGYLQRLAKGIESFGLLVARDKILQAGHLLGIEITAEELAAWKQLRNDPAHGDFQSVMSTDEELQLALDRHASVANILNKLALGQIGYTGPYRDYGILGWPLRKLHQ